MKTKKSKDFNPNPIMPEPFQMFRDGRHLTDVAIELDIESPTTICYYEDYLKLTNMRKMVTICNELKDDLPLYLRLNGRIKKEGLGKQHLDGLLEIHNLFLDLKKRVDLCNDDIWYLHSKKVKMEKDLDEKRKRSLVLVWHA